MARAPRIQPAGAIQHVTARSNKGMALFADDEEHQLFSQMLWRTIATSTGSACPTA